MSNRKLSFRVGRGHLALVWRPENNCGNVCKVNFRQVIGFVPQLLLTLFLTKIKIKASLENRRKPLDNAFANLLQRWDIVTISSTSNLSGSVERTQEMMVTMNSNIRPLIELEAAIVELEEAISHRPKWDRLLDTLRKLCAKAQDYRRKGNLLEARLTLNAAFRLAEQGKNEVRKVEQTT